MKKYQTFFFTIFTSIGRIPVSITCLWTGSPILFINISSNCSITWQRNKYNQQINYLYKGCQTSKKLLYNQWTTLFLMRWKNIGESKSTDIYWEELWVWAFTSQPFLYSFNDISSLPVQIKAISCPWVINQMQVECLVEK